MSRDGIAALPRGATGLSAVFDCCISRLYSLTIFALKIYVLFIAARIVSGDVVE